MTKLSKLIDNEEIFHNTYFVVTLKDELEKKSNKLYDSIINSDNPTDKMYDRVDELSELIRCIEDVMFASEEDVDGFKNAYDEFVKEYYFYQTIYGGLSNMSFNIIV